MRYIRILCYLGLLTLSVSFSISIINTYWIKNLWDTNIPNLNMTLEARKLMDVHFISGIFCMLFYILQRIIVSLKFLKYNFVQYAIHIPIGFLLYIFGMITGVCGLEYIIKYSTIGGVFMNIAFGIYGSLLFHISLIGLIVSYLVVAKYPCRCNPRILHYQINNIFGALIFSSLFYRILYMYAKWFGYSVPTNSTPASYYNRELDQKFQLSFYIIPVSLTALYGIFKYNKFKKAKEIFQYIMLLIIIITIVLSFIPR